MLLANKNNTFAGNFGFVGNKMAFTRVKTTKIKAILLLTKQCKYYLFNHNVYKTIEIYLLKLIHSFKSILSYEMVLVVCEGRFFEQMGDAMGFAQKIVLEQTTSALGERLFYIMLL
jgi:hypothetical protein